MQTSKLPSLSSHHTFSAKTSYYKQIKYSTNTSEIKISWNFYCIVSLSNFFVCCLTYLDCMSCLSTVLIDIRHSVGGIICRLGAPFFSPLCVGLFSTVCWTFLHCVLDFSPMCVSQLLIDIRHSVGGVLLNLSTWSSLLPELILPPLCNSIPPIQLSHLPQWIVIGFQKIIIFFLATKELLL